MKFNKKKTKYLICIPLRAGEQEEEKEEKEQNDPSHIYRYIERPPWIKRKKKTEEEKRIQTYIQSLSKKSKSKACPHCGKIEKNKNNIHECEP